MLIPGKPEKDVVTERHRESRRPADWELPVGVDRALWDYLNNDSVAYDYDTYFSEHNLLRLDREFLDRHFVRPGRLLDLGCGTARLTIHFARRGFDAIGVDLSEKMLAVARQKFQQEGLPAVLVKANICALDCFASESVDYAISMFSTLGMVIGSEERQQAIRSTHRLLRPGGLFGLHLHNWWYNLSDPQGRRWLLRDAMKRLLGRPGAGDKVMESYRGIPGLRLHVFTAREVLREMSRGGFTLREAYPLCPSRSGRWAGAPWLANFRSNGWLWMFEKA